MPNRQRARRPGRLALLLAILPLAAAVMGQSGRAEAAAPWIYRGLVLPRHDVALDIGLGYGHAPPSPNVETSGFGLNLGVAVGVTHNFELGFRTGFRLDDGGQRTQADGYGRPFETETYGVNHDRVANPELKFRWSVARGPAAELGLDLRMYLPIENGASFGFMFGLPIALRAGPLRIDTGLFLPVIFTDPNTTTVLSVPLHVWIQVSSTLWLGPILGLRIHNPGDGGYTTYPLGFGLGTMLSRNLDLRTWFLMRDTRQDDRNWGAGLALQIRFE